MLGAPPDQPFEASELRRDAVPPLRGRSVRFLLPAPASAGHGLSVLLLGFVVEGATEVYQFLARGNLVQGPLEYYTTLTTTIFGFFLMFLGLREWHAFHPKPARTKRVPAGRPWPWFGLTLWTGGTVMTAVLSLAPGVGGTGGTPLWIVWPVGGLVVLAFGSFFFGLRKEAEVRGSRSGNALGWVAFAWSLGVATVAGLVVGDRALELVVQFATNWVALVASVGPIVVAMSPLCVTYALMIGAFWPALNRAKNGASRPPNPNPPTVGIDR